MKKIVSAILAVLLLLGLCACGNGSTSTETQPQETVGLQAGFGRADVSPLAPAPMGGYGDGETRFSSHIMDETYATCVALQQSGTTFLIFTVDVVNSEEAVVSSLRDSIKAELGIPQENVLIGATHTHSAAIWNGSTSAGCIQAAKDALADMAPAAMLAGTTRLEKMNFVRHYLMNDGTYSGSNFGSTTSGYKSHVMDADNELSLIKLEREGKKDILMVNWQSHPASAARQQDYNGISADFVGYARKKVELDAGVHFAYYTGASGNVTPRSEIPGLTPETSSTYQSYGASLGEKIIAAMADLQPAEGSEMKTAANKFPVEVDHSWDHMIVEATKAVTVWKQQDLEAGHKLAREYGFSSVYHARAITNRHNFSGNQYRSLNAVRVGSVAFINNTYEMFCDHGEYVKENSPFDVTFVITGCNGYIPNEASFDYRSYEADTCAFVKGTGEKLADEFIKMLNSLK